MALALVTQLVQILNFIGGIAASRCFLKCLEGIFKPCLKILFRWCTDHFVKNILSLPTVDYNIVMAKDGLVQLVDINDINVPVTSIFNRQSVNAKAGGWCLSEASKELRGVFDAAAR